MVRNCLSMTVADGAVIHNGLGYAVGQIMGVLYAEYDLIGSWDLAWIQGYLNIPIGLFCWIGMMGNVSKSKTMTC